MTLFMTYDIGTTACKACLYSIQSDKLELLDSYMIEYELITTPNGGAEQRGDDWWSAICESTKKIMERTAKDSKEIKGIGFCSQLQGSIFVDKEGNALRNPMIYMDGRSTKQYDKYLGSGFKIEGYNAIKLLKSLKITGGIAGTAKDPLWKYHWVKENEPEIFKKAYKWLDVKDYLTGRCTGQFKQTYDSAHLTWVYDVRPGKLEWSKTLCKTFNVDMDLLPEVISSSDEVGKLTEKAALELGLEAGTPVFGGGGDTTLMAVGSGCVDLYDTHLYVGTSGWVVSNVDGLWTDVQNFIASILNAQKGFYNYTAEQETAGVCLQWVRDHLALDEIGVYLKAKNIADLDDEYNSLYDYMNQVVSETEPGSGNVLFTPWLHGNRAPREDPHVRGMFFNLSLNSGKRQMIRSVLEGVAFNMRWMLEAVEKKVPYRKTLKFIGGGAKSDVWCQITADITGREIETIDNTVNAGTMGAALACAVGMGLFKNYAETKKLIHIKKIYKPRPEYKERYDKLFSVFVKLYENNKDLYKTLNKQN